MNPRRPVLARAAAMVMTAAAGLAACATGLLARERPVLSLAGVASLVVVAAVLTGRRWLGSAAVLAVTGTVACAGVLGGGRVGPGHLLGAAALLLGLVAGLDRVERAPAAARTSVVLRTTSGRRLVVPVLALVAAAGVALAAGRPVPPSVGLALLGLAAGIAALVVATSSL